MSRNCGRDTWMRIPTGVSHERVCFWHFSDVPVRAGSCPLPGVNRSSRNGSCWRCCFPASSACSSAGIRRCARRSSIRSRRCGTRNCCRSVRAARLPQHRHDLNASVETRALHDRLVDLSVRRFRANVEGADSRRARHLADDRGHFRVVVAARPLAHVPARWAPVRRQTASAEASAGHDQTGLSQPGGRRRGTCAHERKTEHIPVQNERDML